MALEIGRTVRQLRRERGLTQAALAQRAGLNQGFISEIERGNRSPSHASLAALAGVLEVSPVALLGGQAAPEAVKEVLLYAAALGTQDDVNAVSNETYPVLRRLWRADRYVLRVGPDGLEPTLKPDDLVLVQRRAGVAAGYVLGKICVCVVAGQAMLRRVMVEQHGGRAVVVLRGDNPDVAPVVVDEGGEFRIEGVAVCLVERML